jgi:predicted metal-dependent peptidase
MEVEKALKRLLIKSPFYGLFCLSLPKVVTTEVDTLCVRKKSLNFELCINPDFWSQHTDDEQIALLQHELSHIALQHIFIHESFPNKKLFNLAAD